MTQTPSTSPHAMSASLVELSNSIEQPFANRLDGQENSISK